MGRRNHWHHSRKSVRIDGGIVGLLLAASFLIASYFYYEANSVDLIFMRMVVIPIVEEAVRGTTYWIGSLVIAGIIFWVGREVF